MGNGWPAEWRLWTLEATFYAMKTTTAAVTVLASLLAIPAASLDVSPQKLTLRGGFSLNPDQGHGGVQVKIGKGLKISGDSRQQFRPSLDLGLGNGVRLVTFGADLVLPIGKGTVRPSWAPARA